MNNEPVSSLIPFFHCVNLWFEENTQTGGETAESVLLTHLKEYEMPGSDYFNNTKKVLSDDILKDCISWAATQHNCLYLTPKKGEPYIKGRHFVCKELPPAKDVKGGETIKRWTHRKSTGV